MPLQDANPMPSFGGFGLSEASELQQGAYPDAGQVITGRHDRGEPTDEPMWCLPGQTMDTDSGSFTRVSSGGGHMEVPK